MKFFFYNRTTTINMNSTLNPNAPEWIPQAKRDEKLLKKINNLPTNIRDIIKLYTLNTPVKQELQELIQFREDIRQHQFIWGKVSSDWMKYVREIEDWSLIWGHGFYIDTHGISRVYRDEQEVRESEQEHWRRPMPIRHATTVFEKTAILVEQIDFDDLLIFIGGDIE